MTKLLKTRLFVVIVLVILAVYKGDGKRSVVYAHHRGFNGNEVFTNIHLGNMEDIMENEISNIMHFQLENVNEVSFLLRAENVQYVQVHCKAEEKNLTF